MDGLEKIQLSDTPPPARSRLGGVQSIPPSQQTQPMPRRTSRFKVNKKTLSIIGSVVGVLVVIGIIIAIQARAVVASATKTQTQAKVAYDAIKKQDLATAKTELAKTRTDLADTQKQLSAMAWTQFIPIVGWYYSDADHGLKAASNAIDAGDVVISAILPYADVLGLKGQGSFAGGSAEERISKAVATLDKITPQIPALQGKMEAIEKELSYIDPNRYPDKIGSHEVKPLIIQAKQYAEDGKVAVTEARPLLEVLPSLLGQPNEKKYLVLFQNDKELRPSGGFLTAYAYFRINKGVIALDGSNDMYEMDSRLTKKVPAPQIILDYLPLVYNLNLRDSNLSPDFVASMKNFEDLYQYVSGKQNYDGIIAIDTHVLVTVLNILGEVQAGGITYNTKPDARCSGCPQVIYEMENYSTRPVGYVRAERKDNIGVLMQAIMQKVLSSPPKQYWGPLFQAGLTEVGQKHVLFYMKDAKAQAGLESLNASGRIRDYEGDYLHINDANFAGAKSNLFVKEVVSHTVQVANDGTITDTLRIDYDDPAPGSDCNLERGGLCLNGVLRDVVRVYVPKGSQLVSSKGSEVKTTTKEDLGKTYFENFITVRPQGKSSLELTYKLPFKLAKGSPYALLIQKQPGTDNNAYTVKVNNKTQKFELTTDKELKINL